MQDVLQYTLPQIELFLSAIADEEKATMRRLVIAARTANIKQDAFKRLLRELN